MHIFNKPNFDFIRWRWHAVALSWIVILAGFGVIATRGLQPGIEFAGGTAVIAKFEKIRDERDGAGVARTLAALDRAARDNSQNLMPYLVDCCHAYVTIGEMVEQLKGLWGEFIEPVKL